MSDQFSPTHMAPEGGMRAWTTPDPAAAPATTIEARVEMQVLELLGDWAHIECSNGWTAWVAARELLPRVVLPPAASQPPAPVMPAPAAVAPARAGGGLTQPVFTAGGRTVTVQDVIPAAAIVVGLLLPWFRLGPISENAFGIPFGFLVDYESSQDGLKLGLPLAALAAVAVLPLDKIARQIALGLVVGAAVLYTIQLQRIAGQSDGQADITDLIGFGVVISAVAAGLGLFWSQRSG